MKRGIMALALLTIVAVTAAILWFTAPNRSPEQRFSADFVSVDGLYPGSSISVLGVRVGQIESVQPQGTTVRVTGSIASDVRLPQSVGAYIVNTSVVSERHLELAPAYTGGAQFASGATIPTERTHAPVTFDQVLGSVRTLIDAFGGQGGRSNDGIGSLLNSAANATAGTSDSFRRAVDQLASASDVLNQPQDIKPLIDALNSLVTAFAGNQSDLESMITSFTRYANTFAERSDITASVQALRGVFDQINRFVTEHGNDVGAVAGNLDRLGQMLAKNQANLAEFTDITPLLLQNLSNTVGPDRRGRIRLNVSSTLTQFARLKPLCDLFPMPLCTGAGFTNPIAFPISWSDPFGILGAIDRLKVPAGGPR